MAGEDNKCLTRKFIDAAWNTGHYDEAREHLATDFVNHTPFGEETRDEFLARIQSVRDAFPDWRMTVDDMLADGDFVITCWTGRGTHRGPFRGIAPTGQAVTVWGSPSTGSSTASASRAGRFPTRSGCCNNWGRRSRQRPLRPGYF